VLKTLRGFSGEVYSVAFSPDGKTLASGSKNGTVMVWQASTGDVLASVEGHTLSVWSVAFSPDGKTLASGGGGQDGQAVGR
jgi:WD40 repeat protein